MHRRKFFTGSSLLLSLFIVLTLFSLLVTSAAALQAGPLSYGAEPAKTAPRSDQALPNTSQTISTSPKTDLAPAKPGDPDQQRQTPLDQARQQAEQKEKLQRLEALNGMLGQKQTIVAEKATGLAIQQMDQIHRQSVNPSRLTRQELQSIWESQHKPEITRPSQPVENTKSASSVFRSTLQIIHKNTTGGSTHSSAFYVTNDSPSTAANITLNFSWPNDEMVATEVYVLQPGGKINYLMQDNTTLPGVFAGKVVVSSDQPLSAQIFSEDYGMISGRVFQTDGVTPMSDISVNIHSWQDMSYHYGSINSLSDGRFYIGGLSDGVYSVHIRPGYPYALQFYNQKTTTQSADPVQISGAGDVAGIDFVVQPGGRIEGTVYAADGVTPLSNLNVDLEQGYFGTCTDTNGHYVIESVPYGDHKVTAGTDWNWCLGQSSIYLTEYYNNVYDSNLATPVPVNGGQDIVTGIDFTLEQGGQIKGRVTAAGTGDPLANIQFEARNFDNGSGNRNAWSDADGYYTIYGLQDADYIVIASDYNDDGTMWAKEFFPEADTQNSAGRVTVSGGGTANGINFTLDPGGSIAGQILDTQTGQPLANINVDLDQGYWGTCTDSNGNFYMPSVHFGGQYVVAARDWNWCRNEPNTYIQEYYNGVYWFDQATPVQVSSGTPDITGIDFSLEIGGTISGKVTDEGGTPLGNLRINVNSYDMGGGRGVNTNPDGTYTVTGLADGDYRVEARDEDGAAPHYAREWYDNTYQHHLAQRVAVSSGGDTTGIDFALAIGGVISGHIYDQVSGNPLPDICLNANRLDGTAGDGACTDGSGYYAFYGLPFGDYEVSAGGADSQWRGYNDYAQEYYSEAVYRWDASPVGISPGADTANGIDFTLEHGGFISGHVQNEAGVPVANIRMVAQVPQPWCQDCTEWIASTSTDADGNYNLGPLPATETAVYACINCDGNNYLYYDEYYNDAISFGASTRLDIQPPNTISGINFTLNDGWVINGDVSVPSGYAKQDIQIDIWRNDGPWYNTGVRTDSAGHYQIAVPPLNDTKWALRVIPRGTDLGGGRIEQVSFDQQKTWDFDLLPGGTISGRVLDNGAPLSGINVNAWSPWFGEGTQTDQDGYFTIYNLPAGDYELTADRWPNYAWQYYHGYPWGDYQRISLETGQSKGGYEFEIEPRGWIEGHVYEADGTTPIENAWVVAIQDTNYWMAWTDPSGYYSMDLPAGKHTLYFARDDYQVYNPVYYPGVEKFSNATLVTVPLQGSGSLVINQNLERYATLSGQISESGSGQGVGGVLVAALNIDPAVGLELNNSTCTDGDGKYNLNNLTAGLTRVYLAGTCGSPDVPDLTQELTLQAGVDHTLNLAVTFQPLEPHRFTIWTYNSMDYTPLTYGGNTYDLNTSEILPALFAPVVALDEQNQWYSDLLVQVPTVENGGAEVVNNQLVVTYPFKPGLVWSDGDPLTASDLRFTWQFQKRPNPFTDQGWQSVMPLFEIESIDVLNPQTAVVKYRPGVFLPNYPLAITYLLPEHVLGGADKIDTTIVSSYAHKPVGNGPYMVEDWVPGSHLDLHANPNYVYRSQGLPKIESIRIQFAGDPHDQAQRGLVDVIGDGDPNFNMIGAGMTRYQSPGNAFFAMFINNELPFFQDPAVRKALYQALDRQRMVDMYSGAGWKVADNYLSPEHPMAGANITSYPYNLTAAAAALDAAGWTDHDSDGIRDKNGIKLDFDIGYRDISPWRQDISVIFHDDLAKIGVHTNLLSLDWQTFTDKTRRGELGAYPQGWYYDTPYDPMLYNLFSTRSIPGPYNGYYMMWLNARWSNPTNDNLLTAARQELYRANLENLYDQQQALMTSEAAIYPIFNITRNMIAPTTLTGVKRSGMLPAAWNIQDWYLPPNPYDLAVRKTLSLNSPAAQPGATIEYSLNVSNLGFFSISNAALFDILPANLSFVSAIPAPSSISGQTLRWDLGDVTPNQQVGPILVKAQVSAAALHGDLVENQAEVWGDQPDSHPENNGVRHSLTVREDVDLTVDKYGVGQGAVGEKYEYYINYGNQGGAPTSAISLTDTLPAGVTYQSANPPPTNVSGPNLTWNLASLPGGQWGQQIHIQTEIDAAGTITNQADIASADLDIDPSDNHDSTSELVTSILAPVITRPTSGVTNGTPSVRGSAPSNATVRIYDLSGGGRPSTQGGEMGDVVPVLLGTTTANSDGFFQLELNLSEGGYILGATAEKSGLTSDFSNQPAITVDHHLPLDPDLLTISSEGVDLSVGCIQAERRVLPYQQLEISAVINCPSQTTAHIKVIENGLFTYTSAPANIIDLGGGSWQLDFRTYLGAAHSTYQIFLEWDCDGVPHSALLLYILVDPDGFLYDQSMVDAGSPMEDALITNGVVTAYVKDGDEWQVWPASLYNQTNPQTTDGFTPDGVLTAGYYSFLTPSGQYRIEATAPGYLPYQSPVITVITTPVRLDIGLTPITAGSEVTQSPANLSNSAMWADQNETYSGGVLTYDIELKNTGQADSDTLTLTDPIPAYTVYMANSLKLDGGGTASYNSSAKIITWQGILPAGGSVHVQFQVKVNLPSGSGVTEIVNTATVTGSEANLLSLPELSVSTPVGQAKLFLPMVMH